MSVTGSGKTMPLLLSIARYDGGNTTVLILPLLAMHDEYEMRARKYKLSFETWTINSNPSACSQIVLVAIEACAWDALKTYIMTIIRIGRLACIAFDEAHLLLQHLSFRPCLEMLEYLGRMSTPVLLMTAMCSRRLEGKLFEQVGRKVYQVYDRRPTVPKLHTR